MNCNTTHYRANSSSVPGDPTRDYRYQFVASAKPDGQCFIVVPKDSPIKTLAEIKGKRIALPEEVAYMTKFCKAELRDKGIDLNKENVRYVREQGAVAMYLTNNFAEAGGLASYSGVAKKWEQDGNRVIHKSVPQPYFPLIASRKIKPAEVEAIKKALVAMPDNEADQAVLKTVGIQGFDTSTEQRLRDLLKWLGN